MNIDLCLSLSQRSKGASWCVGGAGAKGRGTVTLWGLYRLLVFQGFLLLSPGDFPWV